jgi:hypothetical protein
MNCRYCGSTNIEYLGVMDGSGDYGASLCDIYACLDCDQEFEGHCVDLTEDEEFEADCVDFPGDEECEARPNGTSANLGPTCVNPSR